MKAFNLKYLLAILFVICSSNALAERYQNELVILNWAEYLAPELVEAFEKQYDVKIKDIYFESDDDRDRMMVQTEALGVDLILVNGAAFKSYRKREWLQPIPLDQIKNAKYLEPRWLNAFDSAIGYSVPYFWGTLGIAYRKDLLSKPIVSWKQFFSPPETLSGKIVLVNSSVDIIGMALKSLGYSANSADRNELQQAKKVLQNVKPYVSKFGYVTLSKGSSLVTGDVIATMVYGGDALNVAEHHDQITYILPEEGGNIWVDYFAMSAHAKNYDMALKFLNFINNPKWAALNSQDLYLATPNSEAKKHLPSDFLANQIIFPNKEILKNSEFYKPIPARAQRLRASIYSEIVE